MPRLRKTWLRTSAHVGLTSMARTMSAGTRVIGPAHEQRHAEPREALHDRRARVAPDRGRREARGEEPDREEQRDGGAERGLDGRVGALDRVRLVGASEVRGGDEQHGDVDGTRDGERQAHVPPRHPDEVPDALGREARPVAIANERGVEVDGVGHHRGAEHARGEQDRLGALETRDESAHNPRPRHVVDEEPGDEADRDDGEEPHHDELERPLAPLGLDGEQRRARRRRR